MFAEAHHGKDNLISPEEAFKMFGVMSGQEWYERFEIRATDLGITTAFAEKKVHETEFYLQAYLEAARKASGLETLKEEQDV